MLHSCVHSSTSCNSPCGVDPDDVRTGRVCQVLLYRRLLPFFSALELDTYYYSHNSGGEGIVNKVIYVTTIVSDEHKHKICCANKSHFIEQGWEQFQPELGKLVVIHNVHDTLHSICSKVLGQHLTSTSQQPNRRSCIHTSLWRRVDLLGSLEGPCILDHLH